MPVIWKKQQPEYSIVVWQSTEEITELFKNANLTIKEKDEWSSFKSVSRQREWLTVRNALRELSGENISSISYDTNGKPHLPHTSISISHSNQFVAVMVGDNSIGVDIQEIHPRIRRLSQKFIGQNEKLFLSESESIEKLHVAWGAKEVLFKIHGIGGIDFRKDLLVHPFEYSNGNMVTAAITKQGFAEEFRISFEKIESYMLTWARRPNK